MTEERIDCLNCGSANPEWAQVCRSCGVALRHGEVQTIATGRIPTDRDSLLSIGAVIGTILAALLIGLFVSSLNPTDPSVGLATPTPSATPEATPEPTPEPVATEPPATPSATPGLPGTIVFGTELDANQQVTDPVDTFTPGMIFAHTITTTEPFGVQNIAEQVIRINDDGTEGDEVVSAAQNLLRVDPNATTAGFTGPDASAFIREWGPGLYEMRVFTGDVFIARGQFRLAEG